MATDLDDFFERFLKPPKGNSPEDVAARIRHWIDVNNNPEAFVGNDPSPHAARAKRRSARQNLRRAIKQHPQVAAQVLRELETQQ